MFDETCGDCKWLMWDNVLGEYYCARSDEETSNLHDICDEFASWRDVW